MSEKDRGITGELLEVPELAVDVISALSGEPLCSLRLPSSAKVVQAKYSLQAVLGVNRFCQRLLGPTVQPLEDDDVLASLPLGPGEKSGKTLTLKLLKLAHASADDADTGLRLLDAAQHGAGDVLDQVLRLPACPDLTDDHGRTALFVASRQGHLEAVRLLCEAGADVDKAGCVVNTPLFIASASGHVDVVRALCEAGADKDKEAPITPLLIASHRNQVDVARYLCEAGADKDRATQDGTTPLMAACRAERLDIVRLLCEAGASRDKAMPDGTTALMAASRDGQPEVGRLLREACLDPGCAKRDSATRSPPAPAGDRPAPTRRMFHRAG